MTLLVLSRAPSSDKGTFGILLRDGFPLCVTCEDPWKNNQQGESCIPLGLYRCVKHNGPQYQNVWRLEDVPGRDAILIHNGNTIVDTRGCILVGKSFADFSGKPGVTSSKDTLDYLRNILPDEFDLVITQPT